MSRITIRKTLLKTVATALVLSIVLSANMFLISAFADEVLQSDEVPEGYIGIYDAYDLSDKSTEWIKDLVCLYQDELKYGKEICCRGDLR